MKLLSSYKLFGRSFRKMNQRIWVKYEILTFLFAYLRHLDLSLDRARDGLTGLKVYFTAHLPPNEVMAWFDCERMEVKKREFLDCALDIRVSPWQKTRNYLLKLLGFHGIDFDEIDAISCIL